MNDFAQAALVIAEPGPGGLVAAWAVGVNGGGEKSVLWWRGGPGIDGGVGGVDGVIRRQAEVCNLRLVERDGEGAEADVSAMLIAAVGVAREAGLSRVLWPVCGGDRGAANAIDRAMLVSQLALLDGGTPGHSSVRVVVPLVDLDDEAVIELGLDLDVPMRAGACVWDDGRWAAAWRVVDPTHELAGGPAPIVSDESLGADVAEVDPTVVMMPVASRRNAGPMGKSEGGR